MQRIKLNEKFEFPQDLYMRDFTIYSEENCKEQKQTNYLEEDYFSYQLSGAIVHMGSADAGHYYNIIKH